MNMIYLCLFQAEGVDLNSATVKRYAIPVVRLFIVVVLLDYITLEELVHFLLHLTLMQIVTEKNRKK